MSSRLLALNTPHTMLGKMGRGIWHLRSPSIYTGRLFEVSLETSEALLLDLIFKKQNKAAPQRTEHTYAVCIKRAVQRENISGIVGVH